jgi:hypothetical protein
LNPLTNWPFRSRRSIAPSPGSFRHFQLHALKYNPSSYRLFSRLRMSHTRSAQLAPVLPCAAFNQSSCLSESCTFSHLPDSFSLGSGYVVDRSSDQVIELSAVAETCVYCISLAVAMVGDAAILTHATNSIGPTTRSKLSFTLTCS